jgi:uncharacterized membrane protein
MTESGEGSPTTIENALTPVIQAVLEKDQTPAQAAAEIVSEVRTVITRHRGPLPDPETLAAYNQLITNGAERCMGLVEREAAHRHKQEDRIVSANIGVMIKGQWMGLGLAFVALVAAVYLGLHGHDWLAGAMATTTVIGIITVFVLRQANRKSDDDDDDDDTESDKPKDVSTPANPAATAQDRARQISYKKRKRR